MKNITISTRVITSIHQSLDIYRGIIAYRDNRLFTEFLPSGYVYTTLSSVDDSFYDQVLIAKFHLGMFITLLDDFADHPHYFNSALLHEIYKIPYDKQNLIKDNLKENELSILHLAEYLFQRIFDNIQTLPHYENLQQIFKFDLMRVYHANHYSELMMQHVEMINSEELLQLLPFNMGMVLSGMIDVMASKQFNMRDLGCTRHVFHLGQRYGSISNNINTLFRELMEGDITNEITVKGLERKLVSMAELNELPFEKVSEKLSSIVNELEVEHEEIKSKLLFLSQYIVSFDCHQYATGLEQLNALHKSMQGVI